MDIHFRSNPLKSLTLWIQSIVSEKRYIWSKISRFTRPIIWLSRSGSLMVWWVYLLQLGEQTDTLWVEWKNCFNNVLVQLRILQERNQAQAIRIDELTIQHRRMCSEKESSNGIVDQLIAILSNWCRWSRMRHVHCIIQNARKVSRKQSFYETIWSVENLFVPFVSLWVQVMQ